MGAGRRRCKLEREQWTTARTALRAINQSRREMRPTQSQNGGISAAPQRCPCRGWLLPNFRTPQPVSVCAIILWRTKKEYLFDLHTCPTEVAKPCQSIILVGSARDILGWGALLEIAYVVYLFSAGAQSSLDRRFSHKAKVAFRSLAKYANIAYGSAFNACNQIQSAALWKPNPSWFKTRSDDNDPPVS